MTIETLTELDDLKQQKEVIWDTLLSLAQSTPEEKKVQQQYIQICHKILRLERSK
jgi:hypothetical protein